MSPLYVLISLHEGYGLGDAVQMSAVLRHVAKYRPHWRVDYQAEDGRQVVARGLCANFFQYGNAYPTPYYDTEVQIVLYDTFANWDDRPNTRVSSCLHERFGLPWDAECGRYVVNVSDGVKRWATDTVPKNAVALHYQGVTAKDKKDLTHEQAGKIEAAIRDLDHCPYMLGRLPLGYDAEVNAAAIAECRAFIGIDSGPAKCASATETPSLIVWTKHHPALYHDPAPNTTHLVPRNYHDLLPAGAGDGVRRWFEKNYNVLHYDSDPVPEVHLWLREVLK